MAVVWPLSAVPQMREFLTCEAGVADIGAVGVAFLVCGLRQGIADVAALPVDVFPRYVPRVRVVSLIRVVPDVVSCPCLTPSIKE